MNTPQEAWEGYARDLSIYRQGGLFDDSPPRRPAGGPLKTGDIILRLPSFIAPLGTASVMMSGYSHCGIILVRDDRRFVADCFPKPGQVSGESRLVPLDDWLGGLDGPPVLHWLALRLPGLENRPLDAVIDRMVSTFSYNLLADASAWVKNPEAACPGNCSGFVVEALRRSGVPISGLKGFYQVSRETFLTFMALLCDGFYGCLGSCGAGNFVELAENYGLLDMLDWRGMFLTPAFPELSAGFEVAAYGRPPGAHQAKAGPWLDFYRDMVPAFRAAVRCHGLAPQDIPERLRKSAGEPFRKALAAYPDSQVDASLLSQAVQRDTSRRPASYLRVPFAAWYASMGGDALPLGVVKAFSRLAPCALWLASLAGWKPLEVFSRGCAATPALVERKCAGLFGPKLNGSAGPCGALRTP